MTRHGRDVHAAMQDLRLIRPAEGTYCLFTGFGVWSLNSSNFTEVVVQSGMEDLAVKGIRDVMGR
jgi:hypothetical protein